MKHHEQALDLFREAGNGLGEAWALNGLGEATRRSGDTTNAFAHHNAALAAADRVGGASDQRIRAHTGLADLHEELGDQVLAAGHRSRAAALTDNGQVRPTRYSTN